MLFVVFREFDTNGISANSLTGTDGCRCDAVVEIRDLSVRYGEVRRSRRNARPPPPTELLQVEVTKLVEVGAVRHDEREVLARVRPWAGAWCLPYD